jgi:predicted transposase YbfD/YdcC
MALIDTLGEIPDPRRGNAQRHELLDILAIALVASVCGAESCVDFAEFAEDRETLLREFLSLKNGLPSHDTFSRVFRLLDPGAFGRAFEAFLDDLGAAGDGVLAIDGKTLRRSFDRAAGRSALHVVTAFGTGARVAIAQRAVPEGGNETLAARALLETLALDGLLVSGDAMHAHEGTARVILDRGGDYLLALKANRPAMLREVEAFFADPPEPLDTFETTDADHGRVETRRHRRCCIEGVRLGPPPFPACFRRS